ncbi:MAG TPA: polyphenol oxidase family protein [Thermoanaerobaculaceae bacterium]|nr:polyphenol oxidase family protein [Thermoanaerobaculaceae bacterium]
MERLGRSGGVETVAIAGGFALFGDATAAPGNLDAAALAEAAGARLAPLAGGPVPVLYARQEHTRLGFVYGASAALAPGAHAVGTCDALITAEPRVGLCVRTADCLPVALGGGVLVAIVHAGWRGLAADILGATVRRLAVEFGVAPADVDAVIGVGIGPCHYPVGEDVIGSLSLLECAEPDWNGGGRVDLARWARGRLLAAGLAAERVLSLGGCTHCTPGYHSFRRDGAHAGRQWSAAMALGPRA